MQWHILLCIYLCAYWAVCLPTQPYLRGDLYLGPFIFVRAGCLATLLILCKVFSCNQKIRIYTVQWSKRRNTNVKQCKTCQLCTCLFDFVLPTPPPEFFPPPSPLTNRNNAIPKHFSPEEHQLRKPEDGFEVAEWLAASLLTNLLASLVFCV